MVGLGLGLGLPNSQKFTLNFSSDLCLNDNLKFSDIKTILNTHKK